MILFNPTIAMPGITIKYEEEDFESKDAVSEDVFNHNEGDLSFYAKIYILLNTMGFSGMAA